LSSLKPYNTGKSKKEEVAEMFNNISPSYDFLNRFLSMGVDTGWRKKTVNAVSELMPKRILDVATGTGDLAIAMSRTTATEIVGCDISEGMMEVGRKKVAKKGLSNLIKFKLGDSEGLPFEDNSFDAATIAFGIRNFQNPQQGLEDIYRVLRPGGKVFVLEFSNPEEFPGKQFFNFHFKFIMPFWGRLISKDSSAYSYLPDSIRAFPHGKAFLDLMAAAGFHNNTAKKFTFGVASLYIGEK